MSGARTLQGVGVGLGAAVGPVARAHPRPEVGAHGTPCADGTVTAQDLQEAFTRVATTLQRRAADADGPLGEVLGATADMARDPELVGQARRRLEEGDPADVAVDRTVAEFADLFEVAGGYLAERVTDLRSVRDRVVAVLHGLPEPGVPPLDRPSVVVADDLSPADTAALDLDKVLGIVIEQGGPTGHTAIIAGQLGIPCVVRARGAAGLRDGEEVAVDAAAGTVVPEPDDDVRQRLRERAAGLAALAEDDGPGTTSDGHRVALLANIGTAQDADRLAEAAVEGVGLFRTEVLFLSRATAPTQDEQADTYARALAALGGRKVVIRTLDAGADKPLAFATAPDEENPALGVRGFRLTRGSDELLRTQLAAVARAAERNGREAWVMAPMVATV
ncbi:MAG: phosphoenolpyruvate--protein phosphotransferase, partial [Actinotalea sp.]|nr:phosphoenolpyruvate--protein phosphotransferase [Actinotalea sp.]